MQLEKNSTKENVRLPVLLKLILILNPVLIVVKVAMYAQVVLV